MDDQQILILLRKKETDKAFLRLYRDFPKVENLILQKGGSKEDAKDIFQEALIIFYRKAQDTKFNLTSSIGTYLFSVSRFLWKDELKKRNRNQTVELGDLSSDMQQDIREAQEKESRFKLAEQALSSVGERCLELLQRFYHRSMSMREIASDMGFSSEKIAKNQKYKCLERARTKLQELKPAQA